MAEQQTIIIACHACQAKYKVPATLVGQTVHCKKCENAFTVDAPAKTPALPITAKLALSYKFLTEAEINEILTQLSANTESITDAVFEQHLIGKQVLPEDKLNALRAAKSFWQERQQDLTFGAIAVKKGLVKKEDVDRVLALQAENFRNHQTCMIIGDLLVASNLLAPEHRDIILKAQQRLREQAMQPPAAEDDNQPATADDTATEQATVDADTLDKLFALHVTEDGMQALLTIKKPLPKAVDVSFVRAFLAHHEIVQGIREDDDIAKFLQTGNVNERPFAVADGVAPKAGKAAEVKYLFEIERERVGTEREDGHIDFRDHGEIPHVKQNDVLAELIPEVVGASGRDVHGRSLPAPDNEPVKLRCGAGAEISEDGLQIVAKLDGQPKLTVSGKVSVITDLKIPGDVDLKTGHIDFDGNVNVGGSIRSEFRVKGWNLSAKEILAAAINTAGDVDVNGGIIGGVIHAEGSVRAKFMKGAKVYAFGDVVVEKEVMDCTIETSGACIVKSGKILSSEIAAKKGIEAFDVGTDVSNPCRLRVGVEDHIQKAMDDFKKLIKKNKAELKEIAKQNDQLDEQERTTHRIIAEMAQVQDRSIVEKRDLQEQVAKAEQDGSPDALADLRKKADELEGRAKHAEESLAALFAKQDQMEEQKNNNLNRVEHLKQEIAEYRDEMEAVIKWAKRVKKVPTIKIKGTIIAGTFLHGVHSTMVLKENRKHTQIREVKTTDPEAEAEYELRSSIQR